MFTKFVCTPPSSEIIVILYSLKYTFTIYGWCLGALPEQSQLLLHLKSLVERWVTSLLWGVLCISILHWDTFSLWPVPLVNRTVEVIMVQVSWVANVLTLFAILYFHDPPHLLLTPQDVMINRLLKDLLGRKLGSIDPTFMSLYHLQFLSHTQALLLLPRGSGKHGLMFGSHLGALTKSQKGNRDVDKKENRGLGWHVRGRQILK